MDTEAAEKFAESLKGQTVGGWTVGNFVNSGKTALVCYAHNDEKEAAIKIYFPEIACSFGQKDILSRIKRQLKLVDHGHTNLIPIYDGGLCERSNLHYLVMKYLPGENLSEVLTKLPRTAIKSIISQIASAAEFLENKNLVHRDIKPDNIAINAQFDCATLLDLGVIKPVGSDTLSDTMMTKPFLGTLQYSSPEYLMRMEENSPTGWRALTFYQLGAVLHDMIMQKRLFADRAEPYGRLAYAVFLETPEIIAKDVEPELAQLARLCLAKNPERRLQLVTWDDFKFLNNKRDLENIKATVKKLQAIPKYESPLVSCFGTEPLKCQITKVLRQSINAICIGNPNFPPVHFESPDDPNDKNFLNFLIVFAKQKGLSNKLNVLLRIEILDVVNKHIKIQLFSFLSKTSSHSFEGQKCTSINCALDEKSIQEKLEYFLYLILLQALQSDGISMDPVWIEF